jgi:hypothetical protein
MAYQSDRSWLGYTLAAFAFIALLVHGDVARASCSSPAFEVLWAYPADGDVDVPVNAQLWLLTSSWSSSEMITLNGEPVIGTMQSFGSQVIDPGLLQADTDYVLELRFFVGSTDERVVTIAFHTASEPAEAVSASQAVGHTSATGSYEGHPCEEVVSAQDCFDTGQDTLLTVSTEDDDALGWVIELEGRGTRAVWPARCGDPSLYSYADSVLHGCLLVRKIGPGGLLSEATQYCPEGHIPSDAAVPEPRDDASVPVGQTDGGVVNPLDSGMTFMNGGGGTEEMTPPPRSDGTAAVGGGDDEPSATAQSDSGCSVTSQLGPHRAQRTLPLACLLGLLAIVFWVRRSARAQR